MINNNSCSPVVFGSNSIHVEWRQGQELEQIGAYPLDEQGLDQLHQDCEGMKALIFSMAENSPDCIALRKRLGCTLMGLQHVIDRWDEEHSSCGEDMKSLCKGLAAELLCWPNLLKSGAEELNYLDAQTHADVLEVELGLALNHLRGSKVCEEAIDCIARVKDLLKNTSEPLSRIRQFSKHDPATIVQALDRFSLALSTQDYIAHPVRELYGFLQSSLPEALNMFRNSLISELPSMLKSLPDISTKLKMLLGVIPLPHETELKELEDFIALGVYQEGYKLLEQIESQLRKDPDDPRQVEWMCLLVECFPRLSTPKELFALSFKISHLELLIDIDLMNSWFIPISPTKFRLYASLWLLQGFPEECRKFCKSYLLRELPPHLVAQLTDNLNKNLAELFVEDSKHSREMCYRIFVAATMCKFMREFFGISACFLSQDVFALINREVAENYRGESADKKKDIALLCELPLSPEQKEILFRIRYTD